MTHDADKCEFIVNVNLLMLFIKICVHIIYVQLLGESIERARSVL